MSVTALAQVGKLTGEKKGFEDACKQIIQFSQRMFNKEKGLFMLGWNAVQIKVNEQGQVEGTCVGTGMAFDPAFYYYRPVNVAATHGYGPVIMAGAEMLELLKNYQIVINDSAVMFYPIGTDWENFR
jgi:hypothetical protein